MTQRGAGKGVPAWWVRLIDWWHHVNPTQWWTDWHYTDGWGSLGAIVVAILAIIVSAWFNRRTLQQSRILGDETISVTKQQRADLRSDVLRKELAQWLTMVSQVETVCGNCYGVFNTSIKHRLRGRQPSFPSSMSGSVCWRSTFNHWAGPRRTHDESKLSDDSDTDANC